MKTNTELRHAVEQGKTRPFKFIAIPTVMALAAAGFLMAIPCANAQTLSAADQNFMMAAAQGGMSEVRLGQLATSSASRDDVKDFAQQMVKEHTGINNDLKALAGLKGVTLPDSLDAKHQAEYDKLVTDTGSKFDTAYIAVMIRWHKKDLAAFKAEAAKTQDTDIKAFVDKTIPIIAEHLHHALALKK